MFRTLTIALYNPALIVKTVLDVNMTHAHFYKPGFDEVIETDHWILGRQGSSYLALYSFNEFTWSPEQENQVQLKINY